MSTIQIVGQLFHCPYDAETFAVELTVVLLSLECSIFERIAVSNPDPKVVLSVSLALSVCAVLLV